MTGPTHPHRRVAVLLGLSVAGLALAGCSGSSAKVANVDVAAALAPQLASVGVAADPGSLGCDSSGQLSAGSTISCHYNSGGQPITLVAKVNAVNGSKVSLALDTQAAAVPAKTLAGAVAARAGEALGAAISSARCAADLAPSKGSSTTCTLVSGAHSRKVSVTVTSVVGGQVNYTIAVK